MDKLWRILYSPRRVYDELSKDVQDKLPLVTILGAVAISALAIAFLAPHPNPTAGEIENYRKQMILLEHEADREYAEKRRQELREETYGPQDVPAGTRISANPWAPITWPLGYLAFAVWAGTCFFLIGRLKRSDLAWNQWFGFWLWSHVPHVFSVSLDVVFAAMGQNRPLLFEFSNQGWSFFSTTTAIFALWSFVLQIQGMRSWTSKRIGTCIGLVLLANLLIAVSVLLVLFVFAALMMYS
ncbi:MAG: YIP1 family protein [Gammaproteobacteria bacterium]|nr:YIP1 family protein [Gammaproteobacteria bacterium]